MKQESKRQAILAVLKENARLGADQIAERLGLEEDEVRQLIQQCEKDRTIFGYRALVNPALEPQQRVRAVIQVSVQSERDVGFDHIASKISKFPEVTDVILVSGAYDLILMVVGDDLHEVAEFVATKLAPMEGIRQHSTHFMLKRYKEAGFRLEDGEEYERLSVTP